MKIKNFKKYITSLRDNLISFKKYIIGFILGLSLIGGLTYAADSGSIGALFTNITGTWTLKEEAFRNDSISNDKLKSGIDGNKIANGTLSKTKLDTSINNEINSKIGIGSSSELQNLTVRNNISVGNELGTKKLRVSGDTIIAGNTNIAGDLSVKSITINGTPLIKEIKIIDNTWYTISDLGDVSGHEDLFSYTIPNSKYIANIRLSGNTGKGLGGFCALFVPNKMSIGITTKNIDFISLSKNSSIDNTFHINITDNSYYDTYNYYYLVYNTDFEIGYDAIYSSYFTLTGYDIINFSKEFKLKDISGLESIIQEPWQMFKYGYNIKSGIEYLEPSDTLYLKKFVSRKNSDYIGTLSENTGDTSINCKVEVQYGELN